MLSIFQTIIWGVVRVVQKVIKSKTLRVLLSLVVLVSLTIHLQVKSANALGLDTAVKIVAGSSAEHLIKSMGEKMGVKWSQRSLKNTTDYINSQSSKGNVIYADFGKKVNEKSDDGVPQADGKFKDFVIDPFLWLTGADLILTAYDAFQDGASSGNPVEFYDENGGAPPIVATDGMTNSVVYQRPVGAVKSKTLGPFSIIQTASDGAHIHDAVSNTSKRIGTVASGYWLYQVTSGDYGTSTDGKVAIHSYYDHDNGTTNGSVFFETTVATANDSYISRFKTGGVTTRTLNADDVTDVTYVSSNWRKVDVDDDDDSEKNVTHPIVVNVPVTINDTDSDDTNNSTSVWNNKIDDDELQVILKPVIYNSNYDSDTHYYNDELKKIGDPIDVPESFFKEVYKMAQQIDDIYDGLVEFLTKAVLGMKTMVDGTSGLTSFLDSFFDWLPSDMKLLLSSGFMLGVVSFFLRR